MIYNTKSPCSEEELEQLDLLFDEVSLSVEEELNAFSVDDFYPKKRYEATNSPKHVGFEAWQRETLEDWLAEHIDDPYPTHSDKDELAKATGLEMKQIEYWFINTRRRKLNAKNLKNKNRKGLNDLRIAMKQHK